MDRELSLHITTSAETGFYEVTITDNETSEYTSYIGKNHNVADYAWLMHFVHEEVYFWIQTMFENEEEELNERASDTLHNLLKEP